jgi:YHS domain-containing protein
MSIRLILLALALYILVRAVRRLAGGVIQGLSGDRFPQRIPKSGVQMVRDPVCGTFVVPEQSVALVERGARVYFCSSKCRDAYRPRPA